ncbi:hypothetical protein [Sedimentitalea sp.]|uniref:hypothetical protein n=1 Tax=Sedimentitalea sp. TaxID=2048915 RepID=UPI00329A4D04
MNPVGRTFQAHMMRALLIGAALVAATCVISCSDRFAERAYRDQLQPSQRGDPFKVIFSGISTMLIDDGKTQILIDGYFSRAPYIPLIQRTAPDLTQIKHAAQALDIREFACPSGHDVKNCPQKQHRGLSWVIPVHAHYDHAMDSAILAAKYKSGLIADTSVERLIMPSKEYVEDTATPEFWDPADLDWNIFRERPPVMDTDPTLEFTSGDFKITLIKTAHIETPIHRLFGKKITPNYFNFPSGISSMGEGASISVHIKHGDRSMLIIGSAGELAAQLAKARDLVIDTDVVFFGIGGLGLQGLGLQKKKRADLIQGVVETTGARRVIPIHWDSHTQQLFSSFPPELNPELEAFWLNNLNATLETLEEVELHNEGMQVVFAPVLQPFDPFQGLD